MLHVQSVRRRLAIWIGAAVLATVAALTTVTVAAEHQLVQALQAAAGESLVAHLAGMPEFRRTAAGARSHLSAMSSALTAAGATLELVPVTTAGGPDVLAQRTLELEDGRYVLQYRADPPWLERLTRRAVALHVLQGVIALALLLAGVDWITRRHLVAPLGRIAHQVRFMGSGGGWSPSLPGVDTELAGVEGALLALGPSLHGQVEQRLEGERRAAVAGALSRLRARMKEPHRSALALLGDLLARGHITPAGKSRARALVMDLEALTAVIAELERDSFGPVMSAEPDRPQGHKASPAPPPVAA